MPYQPPADRVLPRFLPTQLVYSPSFPNSYAQRLPPWTGVTNAATPYTPAPAVAARIPSGPFFQSDYLGNDRFYNGGFLGSTLGTEIGSLWGCRQIASLWTSSAAAFGTRVVTFGFAPVGTLLAFMRNDQAGEPTSVSSVGYVWSKLYKFAGSGTDVHAVWVGRRVGNEAGTAVTMVWAGGAFGDMIVCEFPGVIGELVRGNGLASTTNNITPAAVIATPGRTDEFYIGVREKHSGAAGCTLNVDTLSWGEYISALLDVRWGYPFKLGGTVGGTFTTTGTAQGSGATHVIIR